MTMESKHTPGPWNKYSDNRGIGALQIDGDEGSQLVSLVYGRDAHEQNANAKLIASAPELLNSLIDARELLKDWGIDEEAAGHALLHHIESVIKKATE